MKFWDDIINTALLGTDKRPIDVHDLPAGLAEATALVQQNNTVDKEEQFLQAAAFAFNYRQCGAMPLQKESVTITRADAEEKKYCSPLAIHTLSDMLEADMSGLLKIWLQQCAGAARIVPPEWVPVLLAIGVQQKKLQPLIVACCGKRGEWLSSFNAEWSFSAAGSDEELWQTGSPEQRKMILQQLRQNDAAQAREWLQKTWVQEDANTKADLLTLLAVNISEDDIPFLESLSTEKSKKVKDAAQNLLKKIPGSAIVQQYQQVLQQAVTVKKEKSLLGIGGGTHLIVELPAGIDEAVFKTGIEKLSPNKELTDDLYIICQLVQSAPPSFWETHLHMEPAAIIQLWQKHEKGKQLLPRLVLATVAFNDRRWAQAFIQNSEIVYIDVIPLLPVAQQEQYSIKFFDKHGGSLLEYALKRNDEWSVPFAVAAFKYTAQNGYQYNRSFYSKHIHNIPAAVMHELHQCAPPEQQLRGAWDNISEYIKTLCSLKLKTVQSFNE